MAVPKKRTSKSKKNIRKANWKRKAGLQTAKALSLAQVWLRVCTLPLPDLQSGKRELKVNKQGS